jgi:hypothetical protein
MNEDEKEKLRTAVNEKRLWPFILATLFSAPQFFVLVSYISTVSLIGHSHLPFINIITVGSLILISAGIALVFISLSWIASPSWCRFILSFYLLAIGIVVLLLFPVSGGYPP